VKHQQATPVDRRFETKVRRHRGLLWSGAQRASVVWWGNKGQSSTSKYITHLQ